MAQRMNQSMPEAGEGWVPVNAGNHLIVLFHKDRRLVGGQDDDIVRPSIVVGVPGKGHQVIRFDPFSVGGHYHVLPTQDDKPTPFILKHGQSHLAPALEYFDDPGLFRGLLAEADESEVASLVTDNELRGAGRQIRQIWAAA